MTRNDAWSMAATIADYFDNSQFDFAEQLLSAMPTDTMIECLRYIAQTWCIDVSEWSDDD